MRMVVLSRGQKNEYGFSCVFDEACSLELLIGRCTMDAPCGYESNCSYESCSYEGDSCSYEETQEEEDDDDE